MLKQISLLSERLGFLPPVSSRTFSFGRIGIGSRKCSRWYRSIMFFCGRRYGPGRICAGAWCDAGTVTFSFLPLHAMRDGVICGVPLAVGKRMANAVRRNAA
jgi:hypothetical protein